MFETDADRALYFEVLGEEAVYTPPGGVPQPAIRVIFDRAASSETGAAGERLVVRRRRLLALKRDFSVPPTAKPVPGTFVIGGETHKVRAVAEWDEDPTGAIYEITLLIA
jgi:hypothetical protein